MRDRERSCGKKVRYDTRAKAKRARKQMRSDGRALGKIQAYFCLHCGFFHLGHLPQSVRSGRQDKAEWRDAG